MYEIERVPVLCKEYLKIRIPLDNDVLTRIFQGIQSLGPLNIIRYYILLLHTNQFHTYDHNPWYEVLYMQVHIPQVVTRTGRQIIQAQYSRINHSSSQGPAPSCVYFECPSYNEFINLDLLDSRSCGQFSLVQQESICVLYETLDQASQLLKTTWINPLPQQFLGNGYYFWV